MKRLIPLLLTGMLTTLTSTQHMGESRAAHLEHKKAAYLVLRLITQEIELIPTESLDHCETIGSEIMKGGKLSKFLKGYKCVPNLL